MNNKTIENDIFEDYVTHTLNLPKLPIDIQDYIQKTKTHTGWHINSIEKQIRNNKEKYKNYLREIAEKRHFDIAEQFIQKLRTLNSIKIDQLLFESDKNYATFTINSKEPNFKLNIGYSESIGFAGNNYYDVGLMDNGKVSCFSNVGINDEVAMSICSFIDTEYEKSYIKEDIRKILIEGGLVRDFLIKVNSDEVNQMLLNHNLLGNASDIKNLCDFIYISKDADISSHLNTLNKQLDKNVKPETILKI